MKSFAVNGRVVVYLAALALGMSAPARLSFAQG